MKLFPQIKSLRFVKFPPNRIIQDEFFGNYKRISSALNIRKEIGLPFWDSLNATFLKPGLEDSRDSELLRKAVFHNKISETISFDIGDSKELENFINSYSDENIAILSKVYIEGEEYHFPLIDFHISSNDNHINTIINVTECLGLTGEGYIIDSGKSYHYLGLQLMTKDEYFTFLGKLILMTPIVDKNWVAHQILEKQSALRVTKGSKSKPIVIRNINM